MTDAPETITVQDVLRIVGDNHEYFSVTFRKRTTGEIRTLNCQRGVKKHLAGGSKAYTFTDKGLISVWCPKDVGAHGERDRGYRCFPADAVTEIRAKGQVWRLEDGRLIGADLE